MKTTTRYQIRIKEQLDDQWAEWFWPLVITAGCEGGTTLVGTPRDQAELHGVLTKLRDLNLTLLSVRSVDSTAENEDATEDVRKRDDSALAQ